MAEKQVARAKDVARRLRVTRLSVTVGLHERAERGPIRYARSKFTTFRPEGYRGSRDVAQRHKILEECILKVFSLGSSPADKAVYGLKHTVPAGILEPLADSADFVGPCRQGPDDRVIPGRRFSNFRRFF